MRGRGWHSRNERHARWVSFPLPASPTIHTGTLNCAASRTCATSRSDAGDSPNSRSGAKCFACSWRSAANARGERAAPRPEPVRPPPSRTRRRHTIRPRRSAVQTSRPTTVDRCDSAELVGARGRRGPRALRASARVPLEAAYSFGAPNTPSRAPRRVSRRSASPTRGSRTATAWFCRSRRRVLCSAERTRATRTRATRAGGPCLMVAWGWTCEQSRTGILPVETRTGKMPVLQGDHGGGGLHGLPVSSRDQSSFLPFNTVNVTFVTIAAPGLKPGICSSTRNS